MDFTYLYLSWTLVFLLIWGVFFLIRKDLRIEMLFISTLFGVGGILSQQTHIQDWWQPITITGTPLGIEDFLIGFAIGGIASVVYAVVYRKKYTISVARVSLKRSYAFLAGFAMLFLGLFYLAGVSSFYAAITAYSAGIVFMFFARPDLIRMSVVSGMLMVLLGSITYYLLFLPYPNYVREFWYLPEAWYATLVFGVPLGEYLWYFLTGAFIGPLFEFIENIKTQPVRTKPASVQDFETKS